jgi:hypothetical protein
MSHKDDATMNYIRQLISEVKNDIARGLLKESKELKELERSEEQELREHLARSVVKVIKENG